MTLFPKIRHFLSRNLLCASLVVLGSATHAQTPWLASDRAGDEARFLYGSQIRRYDLNARNWLDARPLPRNGATAMTGDATGGYVAYGSTIHRYAADFTAETSFATASSSIHSLFLDGNLLVAVHSTGLYSRVTVYNRHTAAQLSTRETYIDSLYGASHAPGINRIFGRTQGISPADIASASYTDAGVVAASQDSPYHGDYPGAAKTWIFPDESRVVDSAGIVYGAEGLAYAGSLAGAVTDVDFHGDVPVVLRGSELIAFSNTLVEAGRAPVGTGTGAEIYVAGTDALIFSPGTADPAVQTVPLSSINAPEPGAPVNPEGLAYTVDEAFQDKDGNLLLFSKAQMNLFRWSPVERRYTASYPLVGLPKFAAYSKTGHSTYFAYDSGLIRKMDMAAAVPKEAALFNLPATPLGLATAGEFIFSDDSSGAWGTHYVHSPAGTLLHSLDWNYYSRVWEWDPVKRRMYFFRDSQSPNDLHWESIDTSGRITGEGETPYHGDFTVATPIRVNGDGTRVVIGSGVVFETSGMTKILNLANGFTDAAWVGSSLYTVRLINGITQLQSWSGNQLLAGPVVRQFNGTPQRLFATSAGLVVITSQDGAPRFILLNEELDTLFVSPVKPIAPADLLVTARDEHSVSLRWQDLSDNEDGFRIEYRVGSGDWLNGGTAAAGATSATVEGLTEGTVHEFRVTAIAGTLLSGPSGTASARTTNGPDEPVGEPYSLAITRIFNNRITLEWQDNATNETGFRVLRSTSPGSIPVVLTVPADTGSFTDTGLAANTTYYYQVQVVNGVIEGDISTQISGRTLSSATSLSPPSSLVATAPTPAAVSLTWKDNSTSEDGFIVERSGKPASTWIEVGRVGHNVNTFGDSSVQPDTAYSYRVRAWNAATSSSNTSASVTTPKLGGEFASLSTRSSGIYYFAFTGPDRIERYDLATRRWMAPVPLQAPATALWADESFIYVAEDRAVIRFALDGSARTPMGNGEATVRSLFTIGDLLLFEPSSRRLTSLDKHSGLFLATFDNYAYGMGGISTAPSLNRLFYRTTGISPSDIGFIEISPDGKLVKSGESPYHGDYPSATRTFVFPDSARVADSSGTVYSTDSLSYTNSLGGSFTDLSFYGSNIPIVLRANKLHSYTNTLLEAGSFTLATDGLRVAVENEDAFVFSADGTSAHGLRVEIVPLSLLSAPEPGEPVDARGLAFTPDETFVDRDGNLLMLSKAHLSLFRWSTRERTFLPSIPLLGSPTHAAYSKANHCVYLAYATQVIRKIDLSEAEPVETPLFNLASTPRGLWTAGELIFAHDDSGAWGTHYYLSPSGTPIDSADWNYYSRVWEWDPVKRRMYFFRDDTSPNDLHWESIDTAGMITGEGETPYHGDFTPSPPIRVSPDGMRIVIGSGVLFETAGMTRLKTLENGFIDGAWKGAELLTIRASGSMTQLQRRSGSDYDPVGNGTLFAGTPLRLMPLDGGQFALITLDRGMPRVHLLDGTLGVVYDYIPDVPRVTGTPPDATEDVDYIWRPDLWQLPGSGALTITAPVLPYWLTLSGGVLRGTPAESDSGDQLNRSKSHRIVLEVRDGARRSEQREFWITAQWQNDAPSLPPSLEQVRANDRGEATVTELGPLLSDPDGRDVHHWRITGNTLPEIFSEVSLDDNGRLSIAYAPYVDGTSRLTFEVTDAAGASVSRQLDVTLPDLPDPKVVADQTPVFSRLTGLYEQKVTVTNVAARAIAGFDLALTGMRPGVTLYNGMNGTAGNASVAHHQPMEAGQSVTMILEYWVPARGEVPPPTIVPTLAPPSDGEAPSTGDGIAAPGFGINRSLKMEDGSFLIEFSAINGHRYRVEYSEDCRTWKSCPARIRAGGNKVQWIDRGPPWTDSHPATSSSRYYRITEE